MKTTQLFLKSALVLAMAVPMLASAESNLVASNGNNPASISATARLNFSVVIPKVLFLGVGTGYNSLAGSGDIDLLTFDYSAAAATVGNGTDSASQAVDVRVLGNNGQINIAAAGSGTGLTSGTDTILWTEILATSDDATNFDVPAVGGTAAPLLTAGKVTSQTTKWNYAYSNTNVVAPGAYTGQITYTATMP